MMTRSQLMNVAYSALLQGFPQGPGSPSPSLAAAAVLADAQLAGGSWIMEP